MTNNKLTTIYNSLIINEDTTTTKKITKLIKEHGKLNIIETINNDKDIIQKINTLKPDIIFLDVIINNTSSFDIIKKTKVSPKTLFIFITKEREFALKAFDHFAFDFLLDSFKKERFFTCLDRAIQYKEKENLYTIQHNLDNFLGIVNRQKTKTGNPLHGKKLTIKSRNKIIFLNIESIKYISSSGYYIEIYTTEDKKFLLRESLSNIINRLNSNLFIRIHRSTIINSNLIDEVIISNYGETDVKINDGKTFRVSRSYKKDFQEVVGV